MYGRVYGRGAITLWFLTQGKKCPAAAFLSELDVEARRKTVALLDATVERGPHRNVL